MSASNHLFTKAAVVAAVASTAATEPAMPIWARFVFSAAGLVLVGWLWRTFIRQAIDNAGLDGARRNSAGWRAFVREEILKADVDEWARHDERITAAMSLAVEAKAIAAANAEVLGTIASGIDTIRSEQDDFRREMRRSIRDAIQHGKYENRKNDDDSPLGSSGDGPTDPT